MSTQITIIADFLANLAQFIDQVQEDKKPVIVVKHGDPVAVLISPDDHEAYEKWKEQNRVFPTLSEEERLAKFEELSKKIQDEWKSTNSHLKIT